MPELPEVEVVKKSLEKKITNLIVKDIKIGVTKLRYKLKKHEFKQLIGGKLLSISRRSKYLIFKFNLMNECNFSLSCHSFFSFLRVNKCAV